MLRRPPRRYRRNAKKPRRPRGGSWEDFELSIPLDYREFYRSLPAPRRLAWYHWWVHVGRYETGQSELFGEELVPPWAVRRDPGARKNPRQGEPLRSAERAYRADPCRDTWARYLAAARRAGEPLFTGEGVGRAALASSVTFENTEDGFTASVVDAKSPERVLYYRVPIRDPHTYELVDVDHEEWQWPWSGRIWVEWDDGNGPMLYFRTREEHLGYERIPELEAAVYVYTSQGVETDEDLALAFGDTAWEEFE